MDAPSSAPSAGQGNPVPALRTKSKAYQTTIAAEADDLKYEGKYKELRKKVKVVEEDNDQLYVKILQVQRSIQRLRIERAIIFERLAMLPPPQTQQAQTAVSQPQSNVEAQGPGSVSSQPASHHGGHSQHAPPAARGPQSHLSQSFNPRPSPLQQEQTPQSPPQPEAHSHRHHHHSDLAPENSNPLHQHHHHRHPSPGAPASSHAPLLTATTASVTSNQSQPSQSPALRSRHSLEGLIHTARSSAPEIQPMTSDTRSYSREAPYDPVRRMSIDSGPLSSAPAPSHHNGYSQPPSQPPRPRRRESIVHLDSSSSSSPYPAGSASTRGKELHWEEPIVGAPPNRRMSSSSNVPAHIPSSRRDSLGGGYVGPRRDSLGSGSRRSSVIHGPHVGPYEEIVMFDGGGVAPEGRPANGSEGPPPMPRGGVRMSFDS